MFFINLTTFKKKIKIISFTGFNGGVLKKLPSQKKENLILENFCGYFGP